jgi:hypothetical protein
VSSRVVLLVALCGLALAGVARAADDVEQAKAHFRRGVELYKAQRWKDAAAEFEAAYRTKPHGAIRFNVAQCRERLEEWPAAYRAYADYLREVPDAKDRAAVRASMQRIEERLARSGTQLLLVYTDPPGARLTLDGAERGATPLQLSLRPGAYALGLALEGYEPVGERVELSASASVTRDVTLKRAPPGAGVAAATGAGAAAASGQPTPSPGQPDLSVPPPRAEPAPLPPGPPQPPRRMWPVWVAGGTAVVAAAAAVWFGASARSDEQALAGMATPSGDEASRLAQSAQSKARAANVLYAVAGGAALAAGGLYVFETRF